MKKYYVGYRLATTIIFLILSICALGPFVYLLIASFIEDMSQVFKNGLSLKISMDMLSINNYLLFTKDNGLYFSWYKNSLIITIYYTVVSFFHRL